MNRKNALKLIIIFLIILFFCLLCLMLLLQASVEGDSNLANDKKTSNMIVSTLESSKPKTFQEVIKKYNSEYLDRDKNKIYVRFGQDLYNENGKSNENYFNNLIEDLEPFFVPVDFNLVDEEKNIDIQMNYNSNNKEYEITFNKTKDFYKETDGDSYINVDTSEIVKTSPLYVSNGYLERLVANQMYLSSIEKYLDEGKELSDGYISYKNGTIKIKLAPNKSVMNIIFSKDYGYSILSDVESNTSLSKIYELHNDNVFGSLNEGYLGYRTTDLYYFFYGDETSVYGYSYQNNKKFEDLLSKYLQNKDLDTFVNGISEQILSYDTFEYDKDIKKAHIVFPTRGIEINIENNDPRGITLYSNYYFTDTTKEFVKNGLINFEAGKDLVKEYEVQRRAN